MFPKTLSEKCDTTADRMTRLLSGVQTGSGAQAAFYSMGIGGSFLIGQGAGVQSSHY
jgi:glucose-6-phosphate isomerase